VLFRSILTDPVALEPVDQDFSCFWRLILGVPSFDRAKQRRWHIDPGVVPTDIGHRQARLLVSVLVVHRHVDARHGQPAEQRQHDQGQAQACGEIDLSDS